MSVNMFDVLGPVTVGPSSSHTAGAVRIGLVCRGVLGGGCDNAKITFYGSFAETYRGHGTDKAVVGGLLGFNTDNELIRDSLRIAAVSGLTYVFTTAEDPRLHPNTVKIEAKHGDKSVVMTAASIGGGAIRLTSINGFAMSVSCSLDTLVIFHKDTQGVLADVSYHMSIAGYNISNLSLSRAKRDGDVITVVETDEPVGEKTLAVLRQVGSVSDIVVIPKF